MKKIIIKNIFPFCFFLCCFLNSKSQYIKYDTLIIEKDFKIKSIQKDTIFFNNTIHITAVENFAKKKHCLKKDEEYIYNIFIDIDSIEKFEKNVDDFFLKIKPDNVYKIKIIEVLALVNKDNICWNIYNGYAYLNEKTKILYSVNNIFFIKDIKL